MEFRDINGYYGKYSVSRDGAIRNNTTNRIMKTRFQKQGGYENVGLSIAGVVKTHRVHRLIASAFIPNPLNKPQINHIDGNVKNNSISNLEWCTASENAKHRCNVLKSNIPPLNFLGKFGIEHNKSKSFWIEFSDGVVKFYGSGLEYTRDTGFDHTLISYLRKNKYEKDNVQSCKIKKGKAKGLTVHFVYPHFEVK